MTVDASSAFCNLEILDSLSEDSIQEIGERWNSFCSAAEALLKGKGDLSLSSEFVSHAQILCKHGLESLVQQHFLCSIEEAFEKNGAMRFWQHFEPYGSVETLVMNTDPLQKDEIQLVLHKALDEISSEKQYQEKCLWILAHALQCYKGSNSDARTNTDIQNVPLFSKYQLMVSSVVMASLPRHFPEVLHWYFKGWLEDLSTIVEEDYVDDYELLAEDDMDLDEKGKITFQSGDMDIDGHHHQRRFSDNNKLVKSIGIVVRDLRNLGLTSMAEDAYASAIFLLLKAKVEDLAGDDFRTSVLESIKVWIQDN